MKIKKRLDVAVQEKNTNLSRSYIQSLIMQGKVFVNGEVCTKSGSMITDEDGIEIKAEEQKYVSRGGYKLEKALDYFNIDVSGLIVLDSGVSTGGFSDCLLQRGVKKVYGVDVGHGQVHEKIRNDERVVLLEKTNLRYLEKLPEPVDLATLDLSFISILKVMPAVSKLVKDGGKIIALIKPQFEAERKDISKGGIVKSGKVHQAVIEKIKNGMREFGFEIQGVTESPIVGASKGNKEFLGFFVGN